MKRKASRKVTDYFKTSCGVCGVIIKYRATSGIQNPIVEHFKAEHPDQKARLYDITGQTWDHQYDICLKALHNTNAKLEQAIRERDAAAAQQRTLAAKLNAIVLVLRNDA